MPHSNSMKAIATQVGVSVMTVSRALSNKPGVRASTRDQILTVARNLGYAKHPLVSALMTQRRKGAPSGVSLTVAHIHCLPADRQVRRNLINLREGIRNQAEAHGFEVTEFYLNAPGMTPKRLIDILRSRGIRAAIFEHFFEDGVEIDVDLKGIAAVAISHTMRRPSLNRVVVAEYLSVNLGLEELHRRGYRRIALSINKHQEQISRIKRSAAWLLYQQQIPEADRIPLLSAHRHEYDEQFTPWFRKHKPDALLTTYGRSLRLINEMEEVNASDIGIVRFGWNDEDSDFAGIDPNWRQIGAAVVNQVIDQLYRGEFGEPEIPIVTSIDPHWVNGPSVRPPLQPA